MKMSNLAFTLVVALILAYDTGLIGQHYVNATETSILMACSEDSDCVSGYDCRSRKGGGTECRARYSIRSDLLANDHSQQCLTDSDCPSRQSCRSKKGGGAECRTSTQQDQYTKHAKQDEFEAQKVRQQARQDEQLARQQIEQQSRQDGQQAQQFAQEFSNALNQFGQQMQNSAQQMQQNNAIMPVQTPNFQPFTPFGGNRRIINCITNGAFTSCR